MIHLNMEAERTKNYTFAANLYFEDGGSSANSVGESFPHKLARWTLRHLELAGFSLLLSVIIGIPLGIVASRGGVIGQGILGFASIVQTIPALALLALLVPLPFFGISVGTGDHCAVPLWIIADRAEHCERLTGYSATATRISYCARTCRFTRLWEIYLPMASRSILSGIKTSAVINIGTAISGSINRRRRSRRADLERPQFERSRHNSRGRYSRCVAGVGCAMVLRRP